jgi:hypothetical protein
MFLIAQSPLLGEEGKIRPFGKQARQAVVESYSARSRRAAKESFAATAAYTTLYSRPRPAGRG